MLTSLIAGLMLFAALVAILATLAIRSRLWNRTMHGLQAQSEIISDLDALISKPVAFRFQGRTHLIKPLNVSEFLEAMGAFAAIDNLGREEKLSAEKMLDGWERVFSVMCPTIKRKHIESMTQSQVGALYSLILDAVMGKAQVAAEKKSKGQSEAQSAVSLRA